jgi:hypothetical protein
VDAVNSNETAERFGKDVAAHEMTAMHDDGLYRHLRFKAPATGFYWFDLITWPGNLVVNGDMGTFTFSRVDDMFTFFRGDRINPGYWAEKVRAGSGIKIYSEDLFKQLVAERIEDYAEEHPGLAGAVKTEILNSDEIYYEDGARSLLAAFEHDGFTFADTWEWGLTDWSYHFLWCCHAIVWGISQYDGTSQTVAGVSTGSGRRRVETAELPA